MAVVPSPRVRVSVAEPLIRDLGRVSEWCDLLGMKINASKTKTMIVSRSLTVHLQSPPLTVLKEADHLVIFGMTFNSKMTIEKHLRSVSRAVSQKLCILRKSWPVFHDRSLLGRWFRYFVMSVLEFCSPVWCSAADTHLKLLDRAVSGARFLTRSVFECDIAHRRSVSVLCICIRSGPTRCILLMVSHTWAVCDSAGCIRCLGLYRTSHYRRTFIHLSEYYLYYSLLLFFPFSSFCILVGIVGLGSSD